MNKRTLKALKASIQKWHDNAYHGGRSVGNHACPLCGLFNVIGLSVSESEGCPGCPVEAESSGIGCHNTPYSRARESMRTATWAKNAEKELHFLVSLLPKNETAVMNDGWEWYWK